MEGDTIRGRRTSLVLRRHSCFTFAKLAHCSVPSRLQFSCDEAIVGVHGMIAAGGELRFVVGLLSLKVDRSSPFVELLSGIAFGHDGSFYREGLHGKQDFSGDDRIGALSP